MPTLLLTALLVTLLLAAARPAGAYRVADKPAGWVDNHLHGFRLHTNRVRADKCLPRFRAATPYPEKGTLERRNVRAAMKRSHFRARVGASRCVPTNPAAIIRFVFPDHVEDQAIRVASCESTGGNGLNPRAANPRSSARGLFQELDTWWATSNNFLGRPFDPFNAMHNTRQALWLWRSSGGTFRWHWAASIGCWS